MPKSLVRDKYCKNLQVFIEYLAIFYFFRFNELEAKKETKNVGITMISEGLKKSWIPFVISGLLGITYEVLSNELKKKSGRIGVMEAIQDLENPKLFVNNIDN